MNPALLVPDPDELADPVPTCAACDSPFTPTPRWIGTAHQRLCTPCRLAGWTAARCACGGRLHRRDQTSKLRHRQLCARCRRRALLDDGREREALLVREGAR